MPVFVQWKWIERTDSLLTIFHFYDDYSKPNLRLLKLDKDIRAFSYSPKRDLEVKKDWISWAPSHPEMALLMQLLSYANIINGLKQSKKKKLFFELEGREDIYKVAPQEVVSKMAEPYIVGKKIGKDKKVIQYIDLRGEVDGFCPVYTCVELCPEYIDFLGDKLKSYLKN